MEQITIIFFALASFFGIEDGRIFAEKTTITINPENKEIEIIQENLFTIIQPEEESLLIREQWNKLFYWKEKNTVWSMDLDNFPVKDLSFSTIKNTIQAHLTLKYSKETDLGKLGIWYNAEENQFYINHIPQYNIKTNEGKLEENYWTFDGNSKFSFTIEAFKQMPKEYRKLKKSLKDVLSEVQKE